MKRKKGRPADRALRPPMRSPGRPPGWRREHRKRFWDAIARGVASEKAAVLAALSPAVGNRWFRQSGGMAPSKFPKLSGRYLSFAEREEMAPPREGPGGTCDRPTPWSVTVDSLKGVAT